ncbi:glycosyltransferase family 2 protein [Neptuniibacter sp. SY11_33]|uniref:glycosyltransferase family 2 protein n=1 Tax=Neptuniibacter sp. SY11_33 TaxID=3398215 RepID=UPI0039F58C9D
MLQEKKLLSIVIPVFNEEEVLPEALSRFVKLKDKMSDVVSVELIFVDDGSRDSSLNILKAAAKTDETIKVLSFSRNFGHQIAITAGMDQAHGDFVAVIDADLQDPPELIEDMYAVATSGYDVVYGKRKSRAGETLFKKATASAFYRMMSYLCDVDIPRDTGDFRVVSRRVVEAFRGLRERHRFVRGMIPWIGFSAVPFEYERQERFAGETKYPLKKMLSFAANAIFSFSKKPLTLAIRLGVATIALGLLMAVYFLYMKLFTDTPVPGLTAILVSIVFFSGVQIAFMGGLGEYIARIFEEAKGRPLYFVAETINIKQAD